MPERHLGCPGPAGSLPGLFEFDRYCGAYVCDACGAHRGLARCFCGWSASGGDGSAELIEMGEIIEEDEW